MKLHQSFAELPAGVGLAVGFFDGVHRGHQAVIAAAQGAGPLAVMTFHPHPRQVLGQGRGPSRLLTEPKQKAHLLAEGGVEHLLTLPFTRERAEQVASNFARELLAAGPRRVSAGCDWRFGRGRQGDLAFLQGLAHDLGQELEVVSVEPVLEGGERISSTRVRAALEAGRLEEVEKLCGRPYRVSGVWQRGRQLGRQLGFPTYNVRVTEAFLPPDGVYAGGVRGACEGWFPAVLNVGCRPTVESVGQRLVEGHVLGDALPEVGEGQELEVAFVRRLRGERKFPSLEALRDQIGRDVAAARVELGDRGERF